MRSQRGEARQVTKEVEDVKQAEIVARIQDALSVSCFERGSNSVKGGVPR